jgi:hypothetical protein
MIKMYIKMAKIYVYFIGFLISIVNVTSIIIIWSPTVVVVIVFQYTTFNPYAIKY